ncbi:MAG TPA: hypothetical protein VE967_05260, partial [Gemmatimonadaceae bacterium]|nr:hypothetical protein [Gemmatimonadaceae bacterium]
MRRIYGSAVAFAAVVLLPGLGVAQGDAEASRSVAGGGISVPGWMGKVDTREERSGLTLNSAKFATMGDGMHVTTGPAVTYWNPKNTASGNYTVKATFAEPKYMNLNDHPHPYGVMIGGNDLGTDQQSYLYCAAYGDGRFIVRGFAPGTPQGTFQLNGRMGETSDAVNKAAGKDQPVKQEIAISVKGDKVECAINGKTVGSYDKAAVVGTGKLKSTDGIYGLRFAHNTEVHVSG